MVNNNNQNSDIDRLFEMLYSPSDDERELAMRQFIELGSDAVAPLIAFLRDLAASNRIPRFQTGQEQQGQAAMEEYCSLLQREGYKSPNVKAAMDEVFTLTINDRLSQDAIFILGELKTEDAIQFLIKIMEANPSNFNGPPVVTEEVKALQAMGLVAVPYLINEIRDIDRKARTNSIEELRLGFGLGCNLSEQPPGLEDMSEEERDRFFDDAKSSSQESLIQEYVREIQEYIREIQKRILRIFSRLKDPRTLPYLEELLKETTDKWLISEIKKTIAHIKGEVDLYTWHVVLRG